MFNNRKGREQGQGCSLLEDSSWRRETQLPSIERKRFPQDESLPQISKLLKRNEWSTSTHFPFRAAHPLLAPLEHFTQSLDGSHGFLSYLRLWWTILFARSIVPQFSGPRFVEGSWKKLRDSTTPLGVDFLEEKREIEATLPLLSFTLFVPFEKQGTG